MKKLLCAVCVALILITGLVFSAYAKGKYITVPEDCVSKETLNHLELKAESIFRSFSYEVYFLMNDEVSQKGAYESAKSFFEENNILSGCVFAMEKESGKCYICSDDLNESENSALLRSYTAVEGGTYGERIEGFLDKITELARQRYEGDNEISERLKPRFMDIAGVVDDKSESAVYTDIDSFSERKKLDVVYVIYSGDDKPDAYGKKFYSDNNFGFGKSKKGVILALNHDSGEMSLRFEGDAVKLFENDAPQELYKLISRLVKEEDYINVFIKYMDFLSENMISQGDEEPEEETTLPDDYFPAFEDGAGEDGAIMPRVYDSARVLSDSTERECISVLDRVSSETGVDFAVVTVYEIPDFMTVSDYAQRYFEHFDFGSTGEKSGVLLLISFEPESCFISAYGKAGALFSEKDLRDYTEEIYTLWRKENFDAAVHTFSFEAAERLMKEKLEMPLAAAGVLSVIAVALTVALIVSGKKKKSNSETAVL